MARLDLARLGLARLLSMLSAPPWCDEIAIDTYMDVHAVNLSVALEPRALVYSLHARRLSPYTA